MSAEVYISSKALAVRFNGVYSPTDRGHLAHELVRIHTTLKNNEKPGVLFFMSEEIVRTQRSRKEELCAQLGLPADEKAREKAIQGFNGYLTKVGFPYYKIKI